MRVPILMAIIVIIISAIIDVYIYCDLKRNFPRRPLWSRLYGVSSILLWAFVIICIAMPRRNLESGVLFQMWALYSYLTIYLPKIIFTIFSLIGSIPRLWRARPVKLGKWVGIPLGIIVFIAMWWGAAVTRHQIEVTNVDIFSSRLPDGFDGYRIVQISDLHTGTWGEDTRFIARLVDSINARKPDLVVFTGDIVNRETRELAPFLKVLSQIHARDGVYSILGNHDYGDYISWPSPREKADNLQLLKIWEKQIGWKMLNNEHAEIYANGDTIQLIGVENWGEPPFHQYGHITDAYPINRNEVKNLNDSRFKILLSHNPEHWRREVADISNIDLTLSGHTHAMQTEFKLGNHKWSPASFKYENWGGLYDKVNARGDTLQLYVNIGAGEVGMPYRIGAIPEVTVITLNKKP